MSLLDHFKFGFLMDKDILSSEKRGKWEVTEFEVVDKNGDNSLYRYVISNGRSSEDCVCHSRGKLADIKAKAKQLADNANSDKEDANSNYLIV